MTTGEAIRKLRIEKGWSQEELAKRSGYASKSAINKIEKGFNDISTDKIKLFAEIFNVSPLDILGLEYDLKENKFIETDAPAMDENTKRILSKFQKLNDQQKMAILSLMQTMIDD